MEVNGQHLRRDGGAPLRLLVDHGWPVSDIKNLGEARLARGVLQKAIAQIEESLTTAKTRPTTNPEWFVRASTALRWKYRSLREVEKLCDNLPEEVDA
jgi:DMSO/TMAO reductase YedYZ molybdopterin-dependent catalytic subunit